MTRIAVLASGDAYGERALIACASVRVLPDAVLLVDGPSQQLDRRIRQLVERRPRELASAVAARLSAKLAESTLGGLAEQMRAVGPVNGPEMLSALAEVAPDYLFLAGFGILSGESLAIPSKGTVNVHPGLLPWARGVGVVERSVERRVPVGVTAHLVDAGIDTGAVIRRELTWISSVDTLASIRRKAYERCTRMLADLAAWVVGGQSLTGEPQSVRLRYCTWPSVEERRRVEAEVKAGVALRLYLDWRERHGDVLPPDVPEDERLSVSP